MTLGTPLLDEVVEGPVSGVVVSTLASASSTSLCRAAVAKSLYSAWCLIRSAATCSTLDALDTDGSSRRMW
jgi:hypothetical protein